MGNTFPSPFAISDLADPSDSDPGENIDSAALLAIGQQLNYLHAAGNAVGIISQTFADNLCSWNTTTKQVAVCTWRTPGLSAAHVDLTVEIRASATVAAGTVDFNVGGGTVSITVNVGATAYYTHAGTLNSAGTGTDIITMDVTAGAGGTVTVEHVRVSVDPLSTPLASGAVGDFEPFGEDSLAADYCLPSHRGAQMIDGIGALMERPRVLMAWSGLDRVDAYIAGAQQLMDAHAHRTFAPAILGALDAGIGYEMAALLHSDPADETRLRLLTSEDLALAPDNEVLIAAAAATAWVSLDDGESGLDAKLAEGSIRLDGLPGSPILVRPAGDQGVAIESSTAGVASISVWGP